MANPFRIPAIRGQRKLEDPELEHQVGLPSAAARLPSDKALSTNSLSTPTETPSLDEKEMSPRQARFKRLAGILGPRKA